MARSRRADPAGRGASRDVVASAGNAAKPRCLTRLRVFQRFCQDSRRATMASIQAEVRDAFLGQILLGAVTFAALGGLIDAMHSRNRAIIEPPPFTPAVRWRISL